MGKRRKKKLPGEEVFEETTEEEEVDTSTEEDSEKEQRKYKPCVVSDYNRRKIICVKRIMRKLKNDAGRSLIQPTDTVAITFAFNVLPDHVDLHGWRFVPVFIAGDFKAHHTLWECSELDSRGRDVFVSIDDNNLIILNDGQMTTVESHRWRQNASDLTLVSSSLALSYLIELVKQAIHESTPSNQSSNRNVNINLQSLKINKKNLYLGGI
ncbi:unnamed protein product [Parnassius apollo]|uniref:(apollo) hypothetical protein n=1 Tax=Parnassius apollo TaxID=110799 RepID=A0A8S3WJ48_PARAO|nr:unnamed protein product [Parnassius apollo]